MAQPTAQMAQYHNIDPLLLAGSSNFYQDQQPIANEHAQVADESNVDPILPTLNQDRSTGLANENETAAHADGRDTTGKFGIPYDVYKSLLGQPYDVSWPQKWGMELATIAKMFKPPYQTFEALYRHRVLIMQDELCGSCIYSRGGIEYPLELVAKIVGEVRLPDSSLRPHVKIMCREECWAELPACRGPSQIAQVFEDLVREDVGSHVTRNAFRSFHNVKVQRDAVYIGTLYQLRAAWSVWRSEMDTWAEERDIKYRRTRGEKRKRSSSQTMDQEASTAEPDSARPTRRRRKAPASKSKSTG
ncbi:MAG: hypothetical protein Q9228_003005 [Teloschistes exilis]